MIERRKSGYSEVTSLRTVCKKHVYPLLEPGGNSVNALISPDETNIRATEITLFIASGAIANRDPAFDGFYGLFPVRWRSSTDQNEVAAALQKQARRFETRACPIKRSREGGTGVLSAFWKEFVNMAG